MFLLRVLRRRNLLRRRINCRSSGIVINHGRRIRRLLRLLLRCLLLIHVHLLRLLPIIILLLRRLFLRIISMGILLRFLLCFVMRIRRRRRIVCRIR